MSEGDMSPERIRAMFRAKFGRLPTPEEVAIAAAIVERERSK